MKKILIFLVYIAVVAGATYSNVHWTHLDSVLTQPLLNQQDMFVKAEQEAKEAEVIVSNDVLFRITLDKLSMDKLHFVINFSESVKNSFEESGVQVDVSSVATITDYKSDPVDYFLSEEILNIKGVDEWFEYVASQAYLDNVLVKKRDNGTYTFFVSVMPLDQEVSEIKLYGIAYKIMYDQEFTALDMYFGDLVRWIGITPELHKHEWGSGISVDTFGWSVWRTLINKETFSFLFSVLLVGSLLPALAMWYLLGSFRQMLIALVGNVSILWVMRGFIGVINLYIGFSFHEETYTILAYVPVMMLNYSFFMRHFKDFNALYYSDGEKDFDALWRSVLEGNSLKYSIYFVVVVTVIDFAVFMLWPHLFGARSMATVAILAIVSILVLTVPFSRFVMPVLHSVVGGIGKKSAKLEKSWFAWRVLLYSTSAKSVVVNSAVIIVLVSFACVQYMQGKLITESNPGAYVMATDAGVVMESLEASDQPGSGLYKIFIKGDLTNPEFVSKVALYTETLRKNEHVRGVISPTDFLGAVLLRDFEVEMCATAVECMDPKTMHRASIMFDLPEAEVLAEEWGLIAEEEVSKHFFSLEDNTLVVSMTGVASKTRDMRVIRDTIVDLGREIGAIGCDRIAQYPGTDDSIAQGSLANYIGSPVLIGLVSIALFLMIARVQSVSGFNSLVAGCIVVIPFVVSTAVTLIVMMGFGIYLDIATAAIGNITVSAASDLPVFLIVRFREVLLEAKDFEGSLVSDEMVDEVTRAGADVLVNALTYVPLALPFLVAFDPILNLGIMLLVALASCYVGTILALPFLRWCVSSK